MCVVNVLFNCIGGIQNGFSLFEYILKYEKNVHWSEERLSQITLKTRTHTPIFLESVLVLVDYRLKTTNDCQP